MVLAEGKVVAFSSPSSSASRNCYAAPKNRKNVTPGGYSSGTPLITRSSSSSSDESEDDAKFGFGQRIESIKTAVVGAVGGGVALAPASAVHDLALARQSLAQWEFDTDMGALEAALLAIVYRYCIREDDNPQLNSGVVGAFVLTRTLTRIQTPAYCSAAPLNCK